MSQALWTQKAGFFVAHLKNFFLNYDPSRYTQNMLGTMENIQICANIIKNLVCLVHFVHIEIILKSTSSNRVLSV